MSKDTIYREDAIEAIHSYWKGELSKMPTTDSEYGEVIDGDCDTLLKHNKELSTRIKDIPSADRPQGEWIDEADKYDASFGIHDYRCSNCNSYADEYIGGHEWYTAGKPNFCPYCGADMRESEGK